MLSRFTKLSEAVTEIQFESFLNEFMASEVWARNKTIHNWFTDKWLQQKKASTCVSFQINLNCSNLISECL